MRPLESSDPDRVGPYRVVAEVGRGGLGRVLLGVGPDDRMVAVKRVRAELAEDDGFRARLRREVEAARRVSGPRTAAVVDADADAPVPWLASEFVTGVALREAVDAAGPLPGGAVLRLAAELTAALVEVHEADLAHRDLKPANVLLTADGVRVVDFGIARAADNEGGEGGWSAGSPGFMSPEQAQSQPTTPASDVFSLGCLLVLASTGAGPFTGASAPQILYDVVHGDPDLGGVPAAVRGLVERCLAKDPDERPSPDRLVAELAPHVDASTPPWPAGVLELIARRQAEADEFLDTTEERAVEPGAAVPARPTRWLVERLAVVCLVAVVGVLAWVLWPTSDPSGTASEAGSAGSGSVALAPVAELAGHTDTVIDVAFSPDGRSLATASQDGTVRLWDLTSHQQVGPPFEGPVSALAFSPDGRTLITGGAVGTRLWDVASRQQLGESLVPVGDVLQKPVLDVAFSPDGTVSADGGMISGTRLWDVGTHLQIGETLPEKSVFGLAFSPDGRTLASGGMDGAWLWDVGTRQQIGEPITREGIVFAVAFSPDGRTLATAGDAVTNGVRLWDVATRQQIGEPFSQGVSEVAFSPDGRHLVTVGGSAGGENVVRLWDAGTRQQVAEAPGEGVLSVAISPDGRHVAAPGSGNLARLWSLTGGS
ncbi:WD40 repeat domain-containing serine/threonine protein kinase [Saccharothrix longispora]|uniref:WD40 repeat protein n=1 Tax=Saccharothrix longispora TaxID=33920 RepID=A0ABU1Q668_9PSEU|nr:serine/threonine-protein kinase [Saccharothrix longispora]MDR6598383.1 WD40 repeat protein [Saccharothrix longispora]